METSYIEQLKEWKRKRSHVLGRDKYRCQHCGSFGIMGKDVYTILPTKEKLWYFIKDQKIKEFVKKFLLSEEDIKMERLGSNEVEIWLDDEYTPVRKSSLSNLYPVITSSIISYPPYYIYAYNSDDLSDFCECLFRENDISLGMLCCENKLRKHHFPGVYFQTLSINNCDVYAVSLDNKSIIIRNRNNKLPLLDIHHKSYIVYHKAWEYEDDNLITLCRVCHEKEHAEHKVFLYDENNRPLHKLHICDRCKGTGYLLEYDYYESGICFKCDGRGVL